MLGLLTVLHESQAQYNPSNYHQNNYGPRNQIYQQQPGPIDNSFEQKYVNSGQSVMLVCDLPNNMPDGKVSCCFFNIISDSKMKFQGMKRNDNLQILKAVILNMCI